MSAIRPYLVLFCAFTCLGVAAVSADPLYKWVDDQGHVHYTQTPPPSAGTRAKPMHLEVARTDATAAAAYAAAQRAKDQPPPTAAPGSTTDIDREVAIREKMAADAAAENQKNAHLQYCRGLHSQIDAIQHEDDNLTLRQRGERKYTDDVAKQRRIDAIQARINNEC